MDNPQLFNELHIEQKVDFFIKCQKLLIKYHSKSPFVIRKNNLEKSVNAFVSHIQDYKGYFFYNDNICVLFNYIYVDDSIQLDKNQTLRANAYQAPAENHNGVSIDFVVFREIADSLEFIRSQDTPQIKYVLFVKDGKIKLHKKDDLIQKLPLRSENSLL